MDHKQIVNRIWDSQLTLPDGDVKPILIIDLKSSVNSLKYEIYSTLGEYLSGTYTRQIDFTQVSNNRNLLLFYLNQLNIERVFFIRLLEVEVINTQIPNQSSYNFRHSTPSEPTSQVIKITDPIFYFHQLKPMIVPVIPIPPEQANLVFAVDDCNDRQSPPPSDQPTLGNGITTGDTLTDDCCHICQQPFAEGDDIKLLSCNHRFHSREINDWLERKNTCPICSI
jgi:hypothetical protein